MHGECRHYPIAVHADGDCAGRATPAGATAPRYRRVARPVKGLNFSGNARSVRAPLELGFPPPQHAHMFVHGRDQRAEH